MAKLLAALWSSQSADSLIDAKATSHALVSCKGRLAFDLKTYVHPKTCSQLLRTDVS